MHTNEPFQKNVGKLIQRYRIRAGITQLDLELATDMASGSISRIELGKVNPTKETIYKIIDYLELSPIETSQLFGVDINYFAELFSLSNKLQDIEELNELIQTACDDVVKLLNLSGAATYIIEGNKAVLKVISINQVSRLAMKLLPFPVEKVSFRLDKKEESTILKSIRTGEYQISNDLYEFNKPLVPKLIAKRIQRMTNVNTYISIPMKHKEEVIGAFIYASRFHDQFQDELLLLQAFTESMAKVINRHLRFDRAY